MYIYILHYILPQDLWWPLIQRGSHDHRETTHLAFQPRSRDSNETKALSIAHGPWCEFRRRDVAVMDSGFDATRLHRLSKHFQLDTFFRSLLNLLILFWRVTNSLWSINPNCQNHQPKCSPRHQNILEFKYQYIRFLGKDICRWSYMAICDAPTLPSQSC